MQDINSIKENALNEINSISSLDDLDNFRVKYLGKKGIVTAQMKLISTIDADKKKEFASSLNILKNDLNNVINEKHTILKESEINKLIEAEKIDITLPYFEKNVGKIHPITQTIDELIEIFGSLGFELKEGPDIEDDWHNFQALNIPDAHPAREMQDTFYLPKDENGENVVLRTHTSPVQVRTMETQKPPIRIIAPGRTYRCDSDLTHTPMFHQIEGLVIDTDVNLSNLKYIINQFLKKFFELDDVPLKFRPSYFPFTEPSIEIDILCERKNNELKIGTGKDWLEIMGCGMVHPNVLTAAGINPDEYQGFAFGIGIERLAMLKYGISDLRTFFDGDINWIENYGFDAIDIPSLIKGL